MESISELRIGNWVKVKGVIARIDNIHKYGKISSNGKVLDISCVEPIIIDKETWVCDDNFLSFLGFYQLVEPVNHEFHKIQNLNPKFKNVQLEVVGGEFKITI